MQNNRNPTNKQEGSSFPYLEKGLAGDLDTTRVNIAASEQFRKLEKQWNKT